MRSAKRNPRHRRLTMTASLLAVSVFVGLAACGAGQGAAPAASQTSPSTDPALTWPWNDPDARARLVLLVPDPAPEAYRRAYDDLTDPTVRRVFEDGRLTPEENAELRIKARQTQDQCLADQGLTDFDDPNKSIRWDDAHRDRSPDDIGMVVQSCAENATNNPLVYGLNAIYESLRPYWTPGRDAEGVYHLPDPAYWEIGPEPSGESGSAAQEAESGAESAD